MHRGRTGLLQSHWLPLNTDLEPGRRVCAVGDVHGMTLPFVRILDEYENLCGRHDHSTLVILGDLIDRGPDSIGALDAAIEARFRKFDNVVSLMGNHEQMMRRAIARGALHDSEIWLMNGGGTVLNQLGVMDEIRGRSHEVFADGLSRALGETRITFLQQLRSYISCGALLFVHAGINPSQVPEAFLAQPWHLYSDDHWAWIREDFLWTDNPLEGKTVVHGHTPRTDSAFGELSQQTLPMEQTGKLNLDRGSFRTGLVAAAEFICGRYRVTVAADLEFRSRFMN